MRNYDSFNSTKISGTRICPVSFKWLSPFDLAYEVVGTLDYRANVDYSLNFYDQWVDPIAGRYFYLISSLLMLNINPQDRDMVEWDQFYEYVLPSVQGCPLVLVQHALRSATIEFCEKTLIWKQDSIKNDC